MERLGELEVQRKLTRKLIESEPYPVALIRPPPATDDGAGGVARTGVDIKLPVVDRFFSDVTAMERFSNNNLTGQGIVTEHTLIGKYDDDIKEGDYWVDSGRKYKVEYVHPRKDFEVRARVVSRGNP